MNRTEITQRLRPLRRRLVNAASRVIESAFNPDDPQSLPSRTQFSRLVNICGEASCAEEIVNYLRYQAGRAAKDSSRSSHKGGSKSLWTIDLVDAVVAGIDGILRELDNPEMSEEGRDLSRVEAWRLYATYLARAYTYGEAANPRPTKQQRKGGRR